ncbi:MAG: hypothetical protein JJD97_09165, partial [Gemmatimonadaceae bacterium]|nr:hypothetical protein [Gemmatimonadaceae bacterium]
LAVVALLALLRAPLPTLRRVETLLATRTVVLSIGAISMLAFAYEWGSLREPPLVHDEAAYILQARLFAAGKWADVAPIPEFFEQPHVLVTPRLAEKYGPGNALMLVPGIWLGRPGLMPVMMLGVAGALLFVLGRRIVSGWVGLLAWMIWLGLASPTTTFRPSYFSEMLTETLWLAGWWALLRWREDRGTGHLLLVAGCVGWMAITRPLTAVAFAIPLGIAVVAITWRRTAWMQLAAAMAVGIAFLTVIPLWSARTTGNWRVTPLMLYTDQYMPYDVPGFGLRERPLLREASPEIACFEKSYGNAHRWHMPSAIPANLYARTRETMQAFFTDRRRGLILFAALGILASPLELGFMLVTCVVLMLAYTTYAHNADWTVYYLETQPVCALLAAAGVWVVMAAIGRRWRRAPDADSSPAPGSSLVAWCMLALALLAVPPTVDGVKMVRHFKTSGDLPHRLFRQAVDSLPGARKIVFVRYAPGEGCQQNLIQNDPPLATAPTWIVNDRGADDTRLLRAAPDRIPYLFDAKEKTMQPLSVPNLSASR